MKWMIKSSTSGNMGSKGASITFSEVCSVRPADPSAASVPLLTNTRVHGSDDVIDRIDLLEVGIFLIAVREALTNVVLGSWKSSEGL